MAYKNKEDQAVFSKNHYRCNLHSYNKNRVAVINEKRRIICFVIDFAKKESYARHVTHHEMVRLLVKEFDKSEVFLSLYKSRGISEITWLGKARCNLIAEFDKELHIVYKKKYPESIESCGLFLGTTTRSLVRDFDAGRLKFFIPKKPRQDCKAELLILELILNKERVWMRTN